MSCSAPGSSATVAGNGPEVHEGPFRSGKCGAVAEGSSGPLASTSSVHESAHVVAPWPHLPSRRDECGADRWRTDGFRAARRPARRGLGSRRPRGRGGRRRTSPRVGAAVPEGARRAEPRVGGRRRRRRRGRGEAGRRGGQPASRRVVAAQRDARAVDRGRREDRDARTARSRPSGRARDAEHARAGRPRRVGDRAGPARAATNTSTSRRGCSARSASSCGSASRRSTRSPGSPVPVRRTCSSWRKR